MQQHIPNDFFNFRPKCFCGKAFYTRFNYGSFDNQLVSIRPQLHSINDGYITFAFDITPRSNPTFVLTIIVDRKTGSFEYNSDREDTSPLIISQYFPRYIQEGLYISIKQRCMGCASKTLYHLTSNHISFDFNSMRTEIYAMEEKFKIVVGKKMYSVESNFLFGETSISPYGGFGRYNELPFRLDSKKFMSFEFSEKCLSSKFQTYFLLR